MIDSYAIRLRWEADGSKRDERLKRMFAASEARAAGWGGVAAVAEITGLARSRIIRGLKDLDGNLSPRTGQGNDQLPHCIIMTNLVSLTRFVGRLGLFCKRSWATDNTSAISPDSVTPRQ